MLSPSLPKKVSAKKYMKKNAIMLIEAKSEKDLYCFLEYVIDLSIAKGTKMPKKYITLVATKLCLEKHCNTKQRQRTFRKQ